MGPDSFFVTEGAEHDDALKFVDVGVYSSGRPRAQKDNSRSFLLEIGVRDVGEAEVVEAILKQRYTYKAEIPDEKIYRKDLKRFVDLVEAEPDRANLFADYFVFEGVKSWCTPREIYLDQPFLETGLSAYYDHLGATAVRFSLNESYHQRKVVLNRLVKFAIATGVGQTLVIEETTCSGNPEMQRLIARAPGNWSRSYGVNRDFRILGLDSLLINPNLALSQLVWKTLSVQGDAEWTIATYRNNSSYQPQTAPSQLACVLRDRAWLPQADGRFVRPTEASRDLLPVGFPYDAGWTWLEAIGFGQQIAERSEDQLQRQTLAKELGFDDEATLERARRFAALPTEEQRSILADHEQRTIDHHDRPGERTGPSPRRDRQ